MLTFLDRAARCLSQPTSHIYIYICTHRKRDIHIYIYTHRKRDIHIYMQILCVYIYVCMYRKDTCMLVALSIKLGEPVRVIRGLLII